MGSQKLCFFHFHPLCLLSGDAATLSWSQVKFLLSQSSCPRIPACAPCSQSSSPHSIQCTNELLVIRLHVQVPLVKLIDPSLRSLVMGGSWVSKAA